MPVFRPTPRAKAQGTAVAAQTPACSFDYFSCVKKSNSPEAKNFVESGAGDPARAPSARREFQTRRKSLTNRARTPAHAAPHTYRALLVSMKIRPNTLQTRCEQVDDAKNITATISGHNRSHPCEDEGAHRMKLP